MDPSFNQLLNILQNNSQVSLNGPLSNIISSVRTSEDNTNTKFKKNKTKAINILKELVSSDTLNSDYTDISNNNLLTLVCLTGDDKQACEIIETNPECDPAHVNKHGYTPLTLSCKNSMKNTALLLIDKYKDSCNPSYVTFDKMTALHYSTKNKLDKVSLKLLEVFDNTLYVDTLDETKHSIIYYSCMNNMDEFTYKLLNKYESKINLARIYELSSTSKTTLLAFASQQKMIKTVEKIIDIGNCNPNYVTDTHDTTLLWLCYNNLPDLTLKLLNKFGKDCNIDIRDTDDRNTLHYASINNNIEVVKKLIKLGCEIGHVSTKDKTTSLMTACIKKNKDIALILLETGQSNPLYEDENNINALILAISNNLDEVAEKILEIKFTSQSTELQSTELQSSSLIDMVIKNIELHKYPIVTNIISNHLDTYGCLKLLESTSIKQCKDNTIIKLIFNKVTSSLLSQFISYDILSEDDKEVTELNTIYSKLINKINVVVDDPEESDNDLDSIYESY